MVADPVRGAADPHERSGSLFGVRDDGQTLEVEPHASRVFELELLGPPRHVGADDRQSRGELFTLLVRIESSFRRSDRPGSSRPVLEAREGIRLCGAGGTEKVLDPPARKCLLLAA